VEHGQARITSPEVLRATFFAVMRAGGPCVQNRGSLLLEQGVGDVGYNGHAVLMITQLRVMEDG